MTKSVRKIICGVIGAAALIALIVGFAGLGQVRADDMKEIAGGTGWETTVIVDGNPCQRTAPLMYAMVGLVSTALSLVLIVLGRVALGSGDHDRSRSRATIVLSLVPIESAAFFGLRYYVQVMSDLSSDRMKQIFIRNSGMLEGIVIVLTLAIGLVYVLSARGEEYPGGKGDKGRSRDLSVEVTNVKSGLLGVLNSYGYEVADVIVTSYDGQKVAIVVFDTQAAWDAAVESGEIDKIRKSCERIVPDYEIRFEAM